MSKVLHAHVSQRWLFVWDSDWQNYSLLNTYIATVEDPKKFGVIYNGTPLYPVGILVGDGLPKGGEE